MGAAENTRDIQTQQVANAIEQVQKNQNRRKVTRRVLLGAAGAGVCAGAVWATPKVVEQAGYYTKQQLDQALQQGIAQGRQELLAELRNLEGIGLDTAIAIAKITKFAVQYIVKPLADLNSTIQGDIVLFLAQRVGEARGILNGVPGVPGDVLSTLSKLQQLLLVWHTRVSQDVLGQYALADVTAAENYLEALQKKINNDTHA
ncbi:MAG: hypothetical protein C5B60_01725 [Chloroflexi bacterium]|nr:MAG: hypothetical protein C5B60_01725 [Chloroflexota bacterium]